MFFFGVLETIPRKKCDIDFPVQAAESPNPRIDMWDALQAGYKIYGKTKHLSLYFQNMNVYIFANGPCRTIWRPFALESHARLHGMG